MNYKHLVATIIGLSLTSSGYAQLSAVMADTNGMIARPNNFAQSPWYVFPVFFNDSLEKQVTGTGVTDITNSSVRLLVNATNSNGSAAVRLMDHAASRTALGTGTAFNSRRFIAWTLFESVPRANGISRLVVGNDTQSTNNIAVRPITEFVGYEIRETTNNLNEIRIIAHDGTSARNSAWETMGSLFSRYIVGVESDKGTVRLWAGQLPAKPSVITTITNGPSSNADIGDSAMDWGMFATNTNSFNIGSSLYNAWVQELE